MDPAAIAIRVTLVVAALALLIWGCTKLVRSARRGGKGMQAAGMAMMLFGWGHMRDPRNDTVAEAQDGRIRKGTHSGDPE
jgi:membrane protein involved in colicin uptake